MSYFSRRTQQNKGFTIVELLIVIVVIGILSAIVMVAYNGVQRSARVSMVKSDLDQARKTLENYKTLNGTTSYPANQAAAGLQSSEGVTFAYQSAVVSGASTYCLQATLGDIVLHTSPTSNGFEEGSCAALTTPASVVEIAADYFESSVQTSKVVNVTTNVQPTDLIVAVTWKGQAGSPSPLISGWNGAATWTNVLDRQYTGMPDFAIWTLTGRSGPGAVTVTNTVSGASMTVRIYVLRGLNGSGGVYSMDHSADDWSTATMSGTYRITPSVPVNPGQIAILAGWAGNGDNYTATFPAQPLPASGWVKDMGITTYAAGANYAAHLAPSTSVTAAGGIKFDYISQGGATIVVFGAATP